MSTARKFVGGMNVPAPIGRANASVPLAELVLDGSTVTLRPRALGRVMLGDFVVECELIEYAFKVQRNLTSGVGFRLRDGADVYFWTRHEQDEVLAVMASMGVLVEDGIQPVRAKWTLKRPLATTPVAGLSPTLEKLAPVLVAVSVVVLVVLWQATEDWLLRLGLLVLWAFSAAVSLETWWASRQRRVGSGPR